MPLLMSLQFCLQPKRCAFKTFLIRQCILSLGLPCRSKHIEDAALSPNQDRHASAEIADLTLESSVRFEVSIGFAVCN